MKVTKQIVSDLSNTYGSGNGCNYITIHETANTDAGANAKAHANLQSNGNARDASWHYSVDKSYAYQSFGDDIQCWHAGDGQGNGNLHSIAIEICVNSDGNFAQAVENAASLTADLMHKHGIPIGNVVQHNKWSGKDCPNWLRENSHGGGSWSQFIDKVKKYYGGGTGPTPTPPSGDIDVDGYWGSDTTYALQKSYGTPQDGEVSEQPSQHKSKNPGLTTGWDWESDPDDGGSTVIRALQKDLAAEGRYADEIDGYAGPNTIKGLQKHFGTPVDGYISAPSTVVKALQKALNANGHI